MCFQRDHILICYQAQTNRVQEKGLGCHLTSRNSVVVGHVHQAFHSCQAGAGMKAIASRSPKLRVRCTLTYGLRTLPKPGPGVGLTSCSQTTAPLGT